METAEHTHDAHRIVKKAIGIALVIAALAWFDANFHILSASQENAIARNKLQAVFLTNGQIYFGALSRHGVGYWRLDRAHYVQVSKAPAEVSSDKKNDTAPQETYTTLMRLSDDVHRPENTLFIPVSNILFWQNLRNDSPVTQAITSRQ